MEKDALLLEEMAPRLPQDVIFAFNTNIDAIIPITGVMAFRTGAQTALMKPLLKAMRAGVQVEESICGRSKARLGEFFKPNEYRVGGQAGNAANVAASLGVNAYLHTLDRSQRQLSLFARPDRVFIATPSGFQPAPLVDIPGEHALHYVFEFRKGDKLEEKPLPASNRYIASYDPKWPVLEPDFSKQIGPVLHRFDKAYIGGFHLLEDPKKVKLLALELARWKKINSSLRIHLELGEFQKKPVLTEVKKQVFPLIDSLGLNEVELKQLTGSTEPKKAAQLAATFAFEVLYHTAEEAYTSPDSLEARQARQAAQIITSYRAATGELPTSWERFLSFAREQKSFFHARPKTSVGLGDTFSAVYFLLR